MEDMIFEARKRVEWYISGIGIHGLTPQLFSNLTTERLCELYNVDKSEFKQVWKR